MPDPNTIEARLAAVEAAVAAIQMQVNTPRPQTAADWLDSFPKVTDPDALDEAMRLAREILRAEEPPAAGAGA